MSRLKTRLPKIQATIQSTVLKSISDGLSPIAHAAATSAPEDTHFSVGPVSSTDMFLVRWMLTHRPDDITTHIPGSERFEAVGIWATWYYFFAEFGTREEGPHPALMPAWEAGKGALMEEVKKGLRSL